MRPARFYSIALLVWFFAAFALVDSGRLARLEPAALPMILLGLTGLLLANSALLPGFRHWLAALDLHPLVALHLTRYVGIYFLVLYGRGQLPYDFAVKGGWGDIAIASGALVLLAVPGLLVQRGWLLAWNVAGFLDILFVVATAARLATDDASSMRALLRLPLGLLPTFLVPLIIATHVWIFVRVVRRRTA